jgi:DNA-binding transcriptional ArsR family regulator
LALTYLAYGQHLLADLRQTEAREALSQARALVQTSGMVCLLNPVQELIGILQNAPLTLLPGQRRVQLARKGVPRGRPLRPDELVEVVWTIDPPEQVESGAASKSTTRQERLRRLCEEAAAQGAEPTVGDLANALGVTARTVDRDIAALRAAGTVLVTRGSAG